MQPNAMWRLKNISYLHKAIIFVNVLLFQSSRWIRAIINSEKFAKYESDMQ